MFRKLWQYLTHPQNHGSGRGQRSPKRRRNPWTVRPTVEFLENRLTPSTYTVTNLSDALVPPTGLDLRQAVHLADLAGNAGSTINFKTGLNGTIMLQQGALTISEPTTITAAGHTILIDGQRLSTVFDISTPGTVSLISLTIKDGKTNGSGGGVYDSSSTSILVLTGDSILFNTAAESGGGVFSEGIVRVTGSTIDGNTAGIDGGGIYADRSMSFTGSTVANNSAESGGGIYQDGTGTTLNLAGTTVKMNQATDGCGGGIYALFNVLATGSTVNNNTALNGDGGGIYSEDGNVTLSGSTVSGNTATGDPTLFTGEGGGVWADFNIYLRSSTVKNNIGNTGGGGVWADDGFVILTASTVEDNTAGAGTDNSGAPNSGDGGGIWSGTDVTMDSRSTVEDNTANGDGGGIYALGSVTVNGGTVAGNSAVTTTTDPNGNGGGIFAEVDVTLTGATVEDNSAGYNGGGVYSHGGNVYVYAESLVSGNVAGHNGGGVWDRDGNVDIDASTVTGNEANNNGGGVFVLGSTEALGSLFVQDGSLISGNYALNEGGGIYVENIESVTIDGSTIDSNTASSNGGGITSHDVVNLSITNSAITNNTSQSGSGGGLYADGESDVYLQNDTITGNTAEVSGGGVYLAGGASTETKEGTFLTATIVDCVFDNNVSYGGPTSGSALFVDSNATVDLNESDFDDTLGLSAQLSTDLIDVGNTLDATIGVIYSSGGNEVSDSSWINITDFGFPGSGDLGNT